MRPYNSRRRVDRWHNPADAIVGRMPTPRIVAELARFPVQNILVHLPGGGAVQVVARYSYSPHTNRVARIKQRCQSPTNPNATFEMTDIRARIPIDMQFACPLDWSGCMRYLDTMRFPGEQVYEGLLHNNFDYGLIVQAIELIRSVHGRVPVAWQLGRPWEPPANAFPLLHPRDPTRAATPEPMFK